MTSSVLDLDPSKLSDLDVLRICADTAHRQLGTPSEGDARAFLKARSIEPPDIRRWGIGSMGHSTRVLMQGYNDRLALAGFTAVYSDRILVPMKDLGGNVVGFAGRTIHDASPKWVYPKDSYLFSHRAHLLGLWEYITTRVHHELTPPILVEGPFDVVQLWRHGFNAVATHATGFTREQALLLRNVNPRELFVCPDPEKRARSAYKKSVEKHGGCLPDLVKEIHLPDGFDPDLFLRVHGPKEFMQLMREAKSYGF